jgi:hypothetical protein
VLPLARVISGDDIGIRLRQRRRIAGLVDGIYQSGGIRAARIEGDRGFVHHQVDGRLLHAGRGVECALNIRLARGTRHPLDG